MSQLNFMPAPVSLSDYDAMVQFYTEEEVGKISSHYGLSEAQKQDLSKSCASVTSLYPQNKPNLAERVMLVGLGKASSINFNQLRSAASNALESCGKKKLDNILLQIPNVANKMGNVAQNNNTCCQQHFSTPSVINSMVRSILDSSYTWQKHITNHEEKSQVPSTITVQLEDGDQSVSSGHIEQILKNSQITMKAKYLARNLGNERGDIATPDWYEEQVKQVVDGLNKNGQRVSTRIIHDAELQSLGLNLIHSVGRGAKSLPRLIILEYKNNPNSDKSIALVGKGITFDTGGYNLKSTGFIETMYLDNCGAATTFASFVAAVELGLPLNIINVLCLAENSIGKDSVLPSSIIKSYQGKTVEIDNTDAEGRLVLADGLSFVQKNYNVSHVIDLATLTGACVVALGGKIAGLFSNDEEFSLQLKESATAQNEMIWRLPIADHHSEEIKGSQSDLKNTGKTRYGGSCTAAAFLKEFIENGTKWCHLDIAGPAESSKCKGFASGFGVELLVEYLSSGHRQ